VRALAGTDRRGPLVRAAGVRARACVGLCLMG
jgi:hypothetical protein